MKISEVVTLHPSVAAKLEYDMLLGSEDMDGMIAFIMDDNNPEGRRLAMLRHLDELLGNVEATYDGWTLDDFMFNMEGAPLTSMSDEEAENFKKDLGIPPYHLSVIDETDDDIPTGEYEVCQTCGGTGEVHWDHTDEWSGDHVPAHASCPDCEEGLKDITGLHKIPNFNNLDNA